MTEPRPTTVDVSVLGGGPAGATAALHLAREGFSVCLVDPLGIGGALINVDRLPDYPGFPDGVAGWDLAAALGEHALAAGVSVMMGHADAPICEGGAWNVPVTEAGAALRSRAVLVATGCRPRPLPGDDGGLEGRGVSYCAVCDGPVFAGHPVVVVGDGLIAFAEATSLAPVAEIVTVVFGADQPSAGRAWVETATSHDNVRLLAGHTVTGLQIGEQGRVTGVDVSSAGGERRSIGAAAVFGALDPVPNSEPFIAVAGVGTDGRIPVDHAHAVPGAAPGIFAAGDIRVGATQRAVAAAGDGAGAALEIAAFLHR
jgi:thioredoxin reductase (NADPH)